MPGFLAPGGEEFNPGLVMRLDCSELLCNKLLCLVTQSCPTLCDPIDCDLSAPLSMGILQQENWSEVAISFPRGTSQPRDGTQVFHIAEGFFTI